MTNQINCRGVTYDVHPAAELFTLLAQHELRELADDIRDNGQHVKIVRYRPDGRILDGRNRLLACDLAGVEPQFTEWEGDDPIGLVASLNFRRRHMSETQLSAFGTDLEIAYAKQAAERERAGVVAQDTLAPTGARVSDKGKASELAAKAMGGAVSARSIERAKRVRTKDPELFEQLKNDKISVRQAEQIISRREQHTLIRTHRPATGVYSVIAADPPWPYDVRADDETHRGRIPYEPMDLDAICAYLKPERCDDNCILWLWVTNAHLIEGQAHQVLDAWGFKPKALYTWVKVDAEGKPRMGGGNWGRNCTEHVILAIKGSPKIDHDAADRIPTVFFAPRTEEHSEKPELFFTEIADPICPHPAKLELFARDFEDAPKVRAGWVRDGVQVKRVAAATTPAAASAPVEIDESTASPLAVAARRAFEHARETGEMPNSQPMTVRVTEKGGLEVVDRRAPPVIARREWGPGFGYLVDSLCKGDVVQVGGKKKGEALVDGRTKDKKLLVRFEKFDRKKQPDGYDDTPRAIEDAAVVAILHCAPRSIEPIGPSTKNVILAWARDELDVSREPTPEEVEHCWRYLLGMKSPLKANQRSEVGVQLAAAAARVREDIDNPPPRSAPLPGAAAAISRPKRARGPVVDLGEM